MGAYVFNNQPFDSWLNKKSDDILSKVDREMITTEEMIILVLKAQTNHFYHTDIELKNKIDSSSANLDHKIADLDRKIDSTTSGLDRKIDSTMADLDRKIELTATHLEEKFNFLDKKIDSLDNKIVYLDKKIDSRFMWMIGITIATSGGIYLKLFLG